MRSISDAGNQMYDSKTRSPSDLVSLRLSGSLRETSSTAPAHAPTFCVLLGPDYAGKSSVMSELSAAASSWRLISTDSAFLAPEHALIGRLRRALVTDAAAPGAGYSPDFLAAMMQLAVLHLRDRILQNRDAGPVVVDSYYYKIAAKCRLAGASAGPMFDWWRSFPQPRRVLYLDVSRESAWSRCGQGASLNSFEHYGPRPDRAAFERYQVDLAKAMHDEIRHLPVTVIDEQENPAKTAAVVQQALHDELG
jgi:thymidylate kinase